MQIDDTLYEAFLEELQSLEDFRLTYSGLHPFTQLEREDPEVKRLIESLAFFMARTRVTGFKNILKTRQRIFRQFFSYLITPLPAVSLLQAKLQGQFSEPVTLPLGSEVILTPQRGKKTAVFRTVRPLHIFPLHFDKIENIFGEHQGYRLLLHFSTPYPRVDNVGRLSLHLSHLGNYHASLQTLYQLKRCIRKVSVFYDEKVTSESQGPICPLTFGAPPLPLEEEDMDLTHPVEKIRSFFNFPKQELFLNFDLPEGPRNWTSFTICMDLDKSWPQNLRLHKDVFQMNVVPMVNLKKSMAAPILCDGLQERYPVRYPEVDPNYSLHSFIGVFRIDEEEGLLPMKSGVLTGGANSYEVEFESLKKKKLAWLYPNLPDSFEEPQGLAIEGLWYQPWFTSLVRQGMIASLQDRHIGGLQWEVLGDVTPHRDNQLESDLDGLLQMLALQKKSNLTLEEVKFLIRSLGVFEKSSYTQIPDLLETMEVSRIPQQEKKGGLKILYSFEIKEFEASFRPLVEEFLQQLARYLNVLSYEGVVQLRAEYTGTQEIKYFE